MFNLIDFKIVLVYLFAINLIGFLSMKLDKEKAKRHQWRIPEKTLFILALLGGSVGSILGMHICRHKTKHLAFLIGMPVILIIQLSLYFLM